MNIGSIKEDLNSPDKSSKNNITAIVPNNEINYVDEIGIYD